MYVFAMNNKASPPSTNPSKKCRALFPYFPSLESRIANEHTVLIIVYLPSYNRLESLWSEMDIGQSERHYCELDY
jgi:hypothetical protein